MSDVMQTGEGNLVSLEDGNFIASDVLRVVEAVQEYDSNLKIQYLERASSLGQAPYRLMERGKDGIWRQVFEIWELDQRVLDKIYMIDTFNQDVLRMLDQNNAAAKKAERTAEEELREHQKDLAASIVRSPKDTYTAPVDGKVVKFTSTPR